MKEGECQMNKKEIKDYYLGIDAGTNSCGFALTDENYNIIYKNKKPLSGVRLFDEAQTAKDRRVFRSNRRRLLRRKERINLLRSLFEEEINQIDSNFFRRLDESNLYVEDKKCEGKYSLFNDKNYTDRQFYSKFPTIYHLRKYLIENNVSDPRLLYLVCHNIIKFRGHFLFEGQNFTVNGFVNKLFENLNQYLCVNFPDKDLSFAYNDKLEKLENEIIIKAIKKIDKKTNKEYFSNSPSHKADATNELFSVKNDIQKTIIKAIFGLTFKTSKLFDNENLELSIKFEDYEKQESDIKNLLTDEQFELIEILKQLYDWQILCKITKGQKYISYAMVDIYNKHKKDLKKLKAIYKKYLKDKYFRMFRTMEYIKDKFVSYGAYVGYNKVGGDKGVLNEQKKEEQKIITDKSKVEHEEFLKSLKEELKDIKEILQNDEEYKNIYQEIEDGIFLPKIISVENSTIPYQINEIELNKILEMQSNSLLFLNKCDNYGTVKEKIIKILKFKIPYYVGPLNDYHKEKGFAWVVKKSSEKVTPWNFKEVINEEESAQNFIARMTNKCTYLKDEDVLPKNSLIYSEYVTLNILNSVTVFGNRMSNEIKQKVYNELFCKEKIVTKKKLVEFLQNECGYSTELTKNDIGGIDGDTFNNTCGSIITMKNIFGENFENCKEIAENVIRWHTVFTEKAMVINKLKQYELYLKQYFDQNTKNIIQQLSSLKYSGWGNFSKEFLIGDKLKVVDKSEHTGEINTTILDAMRKYNLNLMEIINSDNFAPKFIEKIDALNKSDEEINYKYIDELYVSPSIKRSIWQTFLAAEELIHVMGKNPKKIFVEVTRENKEKNKMKVTNSRRKQIQEILKVAECDVAKLSSQLETKTDAQLRGDRLFFYFMQCGKCAYSGEPIDLETLQLDNYDIDHIIPQSIKKDDSITNRVLVKKTINQRKTDEYPLCSDIIDKNIAMWTSWKKTGAISEEKFNRLIRKNPLSDIEKNEFINRQLVQTNQATKEIAKIFATKYADSKVVYSKAHLVSEFRQKFNILKCREINNLHHGNDAYLNVVVGNVYDSLFNNMRYIKSSENGYVNPIKLDKVFEINKPGIWEDNKTINIIKNNLSIQNLLISKKLREEKGSFFHRTTIYKKTDSGGSQQKLIARYENGPMSDTKKYGGISGDSTAYFAIVLSDGSKGKQKTIEKIPVRKANLFKNDTEKLKTYFENNGLKNVEILYPKVLINSLIQEGKSFYRLKGATGDSITVDNASEWYVNKDTNDYFKTLFKYKKMYDDNIKNERKPYEFTADGSIIVSFNERSKKEQTITKNDNLKMFNEIVNQLNKDLYNSFYFAKNWKYELTERKSIFETLSVSNQAFVLIELSKFFRGLSCADLRLLNKNEQDKHAKKTEAKSTIPKNIGQKKLKLIQQSVTGFYERKSII